MQNEIIEPWYKHRFVWLLILFPAVAVIGGINLFFQAVKSDDGLVSDDYYKEGQEINSQLDRDIKATKLGLSGQLMLGEDGKSIRIQLNKAIAGDLVLKLMHPTRAGQDQTIILHKQAPQFYVGKLSSALTQPRWQVELADTNKQWRLKAEWTISDAEALSLKPTA
ncbi:FixH family protein [Iodobacter fluviatilis]|jgi:hypothetical protein|uniref:Nitrogen fixation protein FixH n=1 Tax=Iodobacter fluviatilis TaxID=537 RepID=A0A7G3GDD4_9NEIS|nr:FixH family protein [Iodobacter fluviatilis]QBC45154.1 hypothetical protein C1H71_17515 [Iodobacter fluviatilis]